MPRQGTDYELVVADVVREMDPHVTVRQGEWVEGPDGERELDVIVEGNVDGMPRRIQIECKDYNPARRTIGIGQIDALESKHRDLALDVSLPCSNAGFSEDAIRKARRVKIGLIGVGLVEAAGDGDRAKLEDQSHARQIAHASQPEMRCADEGREPVPAGGDGEWPLPHAWGPRGRSEG